MCMIRLLHKHYGIVLLNCELLFDCFVNKCMFKVCMCVAFVSDYVIIINANDLKLKRHKCAKFKSLLAFIM